LSDPDAPVSASLSNMRHRQLFVTSLLLLIAFVAGPASAASDEVSPSSLLPTQRQVKTTLVINKVLERFHYRKVSLNDAFAQHIFNTYLKALDPNRSFFLAGDIHRFERDIHQMDEGLKRGKLDTAFEIFRLYRQRVDERVDYALVELSKGFDFNRPQDYRFDRSKDPWPATRAELDGIWHKRVKNDWLTLLLAKKSDKEIRQTLRKRYEGLARRVHQFDSDDVFQAFVNAYTESIEPHTSYMSPSTSENFDISMRLSLEGIGAVLRGDNEYTVVQRTIPGGPAQQSGQLHGGDRIVGVAQGLDGTMEDVVGWRLQDVVNLIRGPKGSVVRLQILPSSAGPDGKTRQISLVRNEIKLEDQASKSYVIDGKGEDRGTKVGVIEVPAFYRDFRAEAEGKRNFRSTTRDVRELIEGLKAKGVNGIVIDLRGNGGGSLTEATELTGLFIDAGPVVQVKDSFGKVEVETDPEPDAIYKGPLAVLVDRNSASASEIFAAAIQDYRRGLIIGEPTFGKGTVQTLIDLNRYIPGNSDDLGRLRLTMAEFFRVSGGSTQLRGVIPDIEFPIPGDSSDHGERSLDNPLPWASIRPVSYHAESDVRANTVGWLRQRSLARIRHDPGFEMLIARAKVLRELSNQKVVSLQEKDRASESARREKVLKDQRDAYLKSQGITPIDEDDEHVDDDALEKQQEVISRIEVKEAARILVDAMREQEAERVRAAMRN
jgi:carboxyl-terminal processing protease